MTAKKQVGETPIKTVDRNRDSKGLFLPGNNLSPGRPPKDHCVTSLHNELLHGDPEKVLAKWEKRGKTGAMKAALAWYKKTATGDMTALKETLDRTEGKVPTPIVGKDDGPIRLSMSADELTDSELAEIIKTSKGK